MMFFISFSVFQFGIERETLHYIIRQQRNVKRKFDIIWSSNGIHQTKPKRHLNLSEESYQKLIKENKFYFGNWKVHYLKKLG